MDNENVAFMASMGFDTELSKSALSATDNNLEAAINWALENKNGAKTATESTDAKPDEKDDKDTDSGEAKSLKCEDCGKLFRSIEAAELHGLRSQHENFAECTEEIKPLTEEEKKKQAERIQQLLVERRLARQKEEEQTERQSEINRRAASKNLSQVKQQMQEAEIKKMQEDRKREKHEDRLAKQRVLEQIAKDKEDRRLRQEQEKLSSHVAEGNGQPVARPSPPVANPVKSNAAQARLQVRLASGSQFVQVFKSSESLAAVRCLVIVKDPSFSDNPAEVQLVCPMLGRTFSEEDMERSLADLGLSPSAVLIAKKS